MNLKEQAEKLRNHYAKVHKINIQEVSIRYFDENGVPDAEVYASAHPELKAWTLGTSEVIK